MGMISKASNTIDLVGSLAGLSGFSARDIPVR